MWKEQSKSYCEGAHHLITGKSLTILLFKAPTLATCLSWDIYFSRGICFSVMLLGTIYGPAASFCSLSAHSELWQMNSLWVSPVLTWLQLQSPDITLVSSFRFVRKSLILHLRASDHRWRSCYLVALRTVSIPGSVSCGWKVQGYMIKKKKKKTPLLLSFETGL